MGEEEMKKEQKAQNDPVKQPEIQDIIMSTRIGIIAAEIAKRMGTEPAKALQMFYESDTCAMLHDKETGLYLLGNLYIADEFMLEQERKQGGEKDRGEEDAASGTN